MVGIIIAVIIISVCQWVYRGITAARQLKLQDRKAQQRREFYCRER